jgi:hypothetical protein
MSVLDPCLGQGIPCPGTRYGWPGPYSEGSGPHPRDLARLLGSLGPYSGVRAVRTGVRCFLMEVWSNWLHPVMYHLFWPRGTPEAVHVVGSDAVHRVARDCRTGTMPSYCSKGYPWFRVPTTTHINFYVVNYIDGVYPKSTFNKMSQNSVLKLKYYTI